MLSYAIGQAEPTTVFARTFGRGGFPTSSSRRSSARSSTCARARIARRFRLWTLPRERSGRFYRELAVGGQVGRTDLDLPWEQLDAVSRVRAAAAAAR